MKIKIIQRLLLTFIFIVLFTSFSCSGNQYEMELMYNDIGEDTIELIQEPEIKEYRIYVSPDIPRYIKAVINHGLRIVLEGSLYEISDYDDGSDYDLSVNISEKGEGTKSTIVMAPIMNFYSFTENIEYSDLIAFWNGQGNMAEQIDIYWPQLEEEQNPQLIITEDVYLILKSILGPCKNQEFQIVEKRNLNEYLTKDKNNFSIVFFDDINFNHNVINVDGLNILDKNVKNDDWPLSFFINFEGTDSELASHIKSVFDEKIKIERDPEKITTVNMTGVTALSRQIARSMDANGVLFPAEYIGQVLRDADITHISNEVPFKENCDAGKSGTVFCSKPEYFKLLEYVGTDVIELTGNHVNDYGYEWFDKTIDIYDEAGIQYFGGGRNIEDARKAVIFNISGNKIAFLGFNDFGPDYSWATEDRAGSAPPEYDYYINQISDLKSNGYNVIFTFQYEETYRYAPFDRQVEDFRKMIEEGADIVSGSQAHQPMGFEINDNGFINYGLGNIFFGQALNEGTKQGIISKHIFYENRHINTQTTAYLIENYSQPRVIEGDERIKLLSLLFEGSKFAEE